MDVHYGHFGGLPLLVQSLPPDAYGVPYQIWQQNRWQLRTTQPLNRLPYAVESPFNAYARQQEPTCFIQTRAEVLQKIPAGVMEKTIAHAKITRLQSLAQGRHLRRAIRPQSRCAASLGRSLIPDQTSRDPLNYRRHTCWQFIILSCSVISAVLVEIIRFKPRFEARPRVVWPVRLSFSYRCVLN